MNAHDSKSRSPRVFVGRGARTPSRARRPVHEAAPRDAPAPSVSETIDAFLVAVDDGSARDSAGRPFGAEAAGELHWCLGGHVRQGLGAMRIDEVRRADVAALVDELGDRGVSARRLRPVVESVRALYDHALELGLAEHNPGAWVAEPDGMAPTGADPAPGPTRSDRVIALTVRGATVGCLVLAVVFLGASL